MKPTEKIVQLRRRIDAELASLVGRTYRYLMMTDHGNVGDTLIFQGELDFLATLPARCMEMTTMFSFSRRLPEIPEDDMLIFRGGGSFGDLWPKSPEFWKLVLKRYPRNPVLFFPQTMHFSSPDMTLEMARACDRENVVICVRDVDSYEFAQVNFGNDVRLVPDMAFYMDLPCSAAEEPASGGGDLLVLRNDREFADSPFVQRLIKMRGAVASDWPTISGGEASRLAVFRWLRRLRRLPSIYDLYVRHVFRPFVIRTGIDFLRPFDRVYATRMHAGILSLMLGKETVFLDNSYGKIRSVYNTWLSDCDNAALCEDGRTP